MCLRWLCLCLRLRRRRTMKDERDRGFGAVHASLPSKHLARMQADWLRGARSRLLRRVGIASRRRVLEIGAGWGFVSQELHSRCGGKVVALDLHFPNSIDGVEQIVADAECIPFCDATFDLVFSQLALLWVARPQRAIDEAYRVLEPGGAFVAIEPDFGGMMEMPLESSLKDVWIAALTRMGADPLVGRKLPAWFTRSGFRVEVRFPDRLEGPEDARFDLLNELPLTTEERAKVESVRGAEMCVAYLPFWLMVGEKPAIAGRVERRRAPGLGGLPTPMEATD